MVEQVGPVIVRLHGEDADFGGHGPWDVHGAILFADTLHTRCHLGFESH